jgi:hypothetical protein
MSTPEAFARSPEGSTSQAATEETTLGTWGAGPFDNDDASDWTYELAPDGDVGVVDDALRAAVTDGQPDASTCQAAIAAAEVVAAGLGRPVTSLPEEVAEWVAAHADIAWSEHVPAALAALDRIVTASELQVLWAESDEATWRASGEDLRTRLGG